MTTVKRPPTTETTPADPLDRALRCVLAELQDGLRHGHFEFVVTCEVIGQDRRRLVLQAGKSYQFVIPREDCVRPRPSPRDSRNGSDTP